MSALPKAIQQQQEEAERITQQLAEPAPVPPQLAEPSPPPQPPAVEPPASPAEPQPLVVEPKGEDADYWKQRFKTVEGMNRQLLSQLNDTREGHRQLQTQVDALRQQPAPAPTPAAQPLVTADDETKFGSDLIEVMRRVVREQAIPFAQHLQQLDSIVRTIAPKAERTEKDLLKAQEHVFYAALVRDVPDWKEVDDQPGWRSWLAEYDQLAGKTRQECLDEASGTLDATRVIGMFNLYKSTLAAAPAPAPTPREQAKSELARQVAPSKSSTTTAPPPAQRTFTGKQYEYWTDHRRVHDTEPPVLQANLVELEKAFAEGRITW